MEWVKIRLTDYPDVRASVSDIKRRIRAVSKEIAFKPNEYEYDGRFGVTRDFKGLKVTMWLPKTEMYICCYKIKGVDCQLRTFLDRSDCYIQKVAYVDVISSTPKRITPSL